MNNKPVIYFKEKKAEKENVITPRALLEHVLSNADTIEHIVFIAKDINGNIVHGCSDGKLLELLGLLEAGKYNIIQDSQDY